MTFSEMKQVVADAFGVRISDINGRGRSQPLATARQTCYYYARKHFGHPYQALGMMFGRDHAAIMHGVKQVENLREYDPCLKQTMDGIEACYPGINEFNGLKKERKTMSTEDNLKKEVEKAWHKKIPLTVRQLELVAHSLDMLKIELEEDWCNCKDQWHDPRTGHTLVATMEAFKSVQQEIDRKVTYLLENGDDSCCKN